MSVYEREKEGERNVRFELAKRQSRQILPLLHYYISTLATVTGGGPAQHDQAQCKTVDALAAEKPFSEGRRPARHVKAVRLLPLLHYYTSTLATYQTVTDGGSAQRDQAQCKIEASAAL